ncbi:MAG: dihydrofolate reductase [Burkholderiales bacterium 66-5]|nr:MAG: dihydrofolate reductase [Burkholderiales bacterium 66-5]
MEIALIYARAANGVIGQGGRMPWHLPEDLAHFKALTQGQPVIMGRKTWDSLPPRFRPLPGRLNIVITRQPDWNQNGAQRASGLREALSTAEQSGTATAWVIGGAQVFAEALPLAARAEVTEIAQDFEGDTWAPALGGEWRLTAHSDHVSSQGPGLRFARYERLA